jgi:hypothetical protein
MEEDPRRLRRQINFVEYCFVAPKKLLPTKHPSSTTTTTTTQLLHAPLPLQTHSIGGVFLHSSPEQSNQRPAEVNYMPGP